MCFFLQFLDSWKTLCDWMNEVEGRLLHKVMIGQSARTKQDLDELKVCFHAKFALTNTATFINIITCFLNFICSCFSYGIYEIFQRFDLQMSSKQPLYCITRRQGVSMRDRCTKSDPDKVIIGDMIEELSSKWNQLRSLVMHR